ncbi:hypothetical protein DI383_09300 [Flavobacteriaceae bacterium LYZ1037]|nr:hypothetical protein DI383_09300 [Flavobacteriaceae bacterium LYZ1037]
MIKHSILFIFLIFILSNLQAQESISITDSIQKSHYLKALDTIQSKESRVEVIGKLIPLLDQDPIDYPNYIEESVYLMMDLEQYDQAAELAIKSFYTFNIRLNQTERALHLMDTLELVISKIEDSQHRGNIYFKKGEYYLNREEYVNANKNYELAIKSFGKKDSIYVADTYLSKGTTNFELGNYLEGLEDTQKASNYYLNLNDIDYFINAQNSIFILYGEMGMHDKALKEQNKLIEIIRGHNKKESLSTLLFNKALTQKELGDLRGQENSLLEGLAYAKSIESERNGTVLIFYAVLAKFYADDDLLKANAYLDSTNLIKKSTNISPWFLNQSKLLTSYLYSKQNNHDLAIKINLEEFQSAKEDKAKTRMLSIYENLYKIYENKGDKLAAYNYFKLYSNLKDSLKNVKQVNALSYYQSLFETETKDKKISLQKADIKILEQQKSIEKRKKTILYLVLILILFLGFTIIYYLRKRSSNLKKQLVLNKEELVSYTKRLLANAKELKILKDEVHKYKKDFNKIDESKNIETLMSSKILTENEWTEFKNRFNKVYPSFLIQIRKNYQDITNSEERLICLEKLNLKTKEIGDILGISKESVVKSRYRLKKKLNVDKDIPLVEYLEN